MIISLIAAVSENNVIGKNGKLPWHLPKDMKYFMGKTKGHHVIMGRKIYEMIGGPLRDRKNIILTRQESYDAPGCKVAHSLDEALDLVNSEDEVFIIGGEEIFKEAMNIANRIYLTRIHANFDGDRFFPIISESEWKVVEKEEFKADEENRYDFDFVTYEKLRFTN